jgi:hypothetical protein
MQPEPNWLSDGKDEESRKWKMLTGKKIGICGYRETFEKRQQSFKLKGYGMVI